MLGTDWRFLEGIDAVTLAAEEESSVQEDQDEEEVACD